MNKYRKLQVYIRLKALAMTIGVLDLTLGLAIGAILQPAYLLLGLLLGVLLSLIIILYQSFVNYMELKEF